MPDREQERENKRAYRARHPDRARAQQTASYLKNREAIIERTRAWQLANPVTTARIRRKSVLARYGLTLEQYEVALAKSKGLCRVCKRRPTGKRSSLCIDHDEVTGQFRGLLCHNCNVILGLAHEEPDRLRALAEYLERFRP